MNKVVLPVAATSGAIVGGVVANNVFPPTVEVAPGAEAEVSLSFEKGVHIESIFTQFDAPNMSVNTPIPGVDGIHAKITELNPDITNYDPHLYESVLSRFDANVIQPTSEIVTEHLLKGAGIGAITATVGTMLVMKFFKDKREEKRDENEGTEEVQSNGISAKTKWKKAVATGLSVLAAAGLIKLGTEASSEEERSDKVPLSSVVTEREPSLEGATLTGLGGSLVNTAIRGASEYSNTVDDFWKTANANLLGNFNQFEKLSEKYTKAKNIVPILHLSDIHCNYANMSFYLMNLVKAIDAPIIVNTGDTFTNSKTMPYEDGCYDDFFEGVSQAAKDNNSFMTVLNVAGNHDPKESINYKDNYAQLITLDSNNPVQTVKGIDFVGMEDKTVTVWEPTLPADPVELNEVVAEQGDNEAEVACNVDESSNNPEVVMAHRTQQLYATIAKGCGLLALSGHIHADGDVRRIDTSAGDMYQHTGGSVSGSDVGLSIYEKAQRDSTATVQYINKSSNEVLGFISIVIHTDGTVEFVNKPISKIAEPISEADDVLGFLNLYSAKKSSSTLQPAG